MTKHDILKQYFGHAEFRRGQEEIVDNLLAGRDVLCVMPTGAGKSVCYQIPALIMEGITLVISPLISLMKDQVNALTQNGVSAAYINSSLTYAQYLRVLERMRAGRYKLIYVAPERLDVPDFLDAAMRMNISMIAVDEAHCVSQWGQDFRPSYLKITQFIQAMPVRPVVGAFTATATESVKSDIAALLHLKAPYTVTTGFDRPNLYFGIIRSQRKSVELLALLNERRDKSGIVYCLTRGKVEEVCDLLCREGYAATRYHAGLPDAERQKNQDDFLYDRKTVMVATNAFGMGIDKSNVSYVIHYNMPKNIESYYQEAGRAGRDGSPGECILLYTPGDVHTNTFLIERSEPNPDLTPAEAEQVRRNDLERLKYMTFYCTTPECLRVFILRYFGETAEVTCDNCSNCKEGLEVQDVTIPAQMILSCVARCGQRYGIKMIIDVLRGSQSVRLKQQGLDTLSTYGLMADKSLNYIRQIIQYLTDNGYAAVTDGEYPILTLTPRSYDILHGREKLEIKLFKDAPPRERTKRERRKRPERNAAASGGEISEGLLRILKDLRKELADAVSVPAYVIFPDSALIDMCRKRPHTKEEFMEVSGVGNTKCKRYGDQFLEVIQAYEDSVASCGDGQDALL